LGPKSGSEWGGPVVTGWVGLEVLCSEGRGASWWERADGFGPLRDWQGAIPLFEVCKEWATERRTPS
jgi:hypothetical protein